MMYNEYIEKTIDLCVGYDDMSGKWYIEPHYLHILVDNNLDVDECTDYYLSRDELFQTLTLVKDRLNCREDKSKAIMDWLFELLTTKLKPEEIEEQNKLVENMLEIRKYNKEKEEKKESLNKEQNDKLKIQNKFARMNFSRKDS